MVTDSFGKTLKVNEVRLPGNGTHPGERYNGSFTAVACCWQHVFFACGRSDGGNWMVMRFRADHIIDGLGSPDAPTRGEVTMTGKQDVLWLSESMAAEKCTLALQPDEMGRRSAMSTSKPRLYVGATSILPHASARGYVIEDSDTMLIATVTSYGAWATDCFDDLATASSSNKIGGWVDAAKCGQLIGLEAGILESIAIVTHLFYGPYVQTFAFFDNKLDKNHVALVRCKSQTAGPCWMEFHVHPVGGNSDDLRTQPNSPAAEPGVLEGLADGLPAGVRAEIEKPFYLLVPCPNFLGSTFFGGCTLKTAMRVPAGLASLVHDSEQSALPAQYFTAAFTGQTRERVHASEVAGDTDREDRIFLLRQPILQTTRPKDIVRENKIYCILLLIVAITHRCRCPSQNFR